MKAFVVVALIVAAVVAFFVTEWTILNRVYGR